MKRWDEKATPLRCTKTSRLLLERPEKTS